MSKTSRFLQKQRAHDEAMVREAVKITEHLTTQFMIDCWCIALHQEFGFGEVRARKACYAMAEVYKYFDRRLFNRMKIKRPHREDLDSDFLLARDELDRALKEVFGDNLQPFDERYDGF